MCILNLVIMTRLASFDHHIYFSLLFYHGHCNSTKMPNMQFHKADKEPPSSRNIHSCKIFNQICVLITSTCVEWARLRMTTHNPPTLCPPVDWSLQHFVVQPPWMHGRNPQKAGSGESIRQEQEHLGAWGLQAWRQVILCLGAACGQCSTHYMGAGGRGGCLREKSLIKATHREEQNSKWWNSRSSVGSRYSTETQQHPCPELHEVPCILPTSDAKSSRRTVSAFWKHTISTLETTYLWSQDWIFSTDAIGSLVYAHSPF